MGIVPNLVTGVWVGGEDRSVHFRGLQLGQGATMALPIWGYYMKKGYEDKDLGISKGAFPRPQGDSFSLNCQGNDPIEATGGDSESIEINF